MKHKIRASNLRAPAEIRYGMALQSTDPIAQRTDLFAALQKISQTETLPLFRTAIEVDNKKASAGWFDPVTKADRACEEKLRALIRQHFPSDGIFGEEYGAEKLDARFVWVIDPIDGTRAFICGVPLWGTLIGLLENGIPVAGLGYQPFIDEAFHISGDEPHHVMRGKTAKLQTRRCSALSQATLLTTTPALFIGEDRAAYNALEEAVRTVRYGTDWYGYALVASGSADIVVETGLSLYDIVAQIPLIEAAGGAVTDWSGRRLIEQNLLDEEAFTGQIIAVGDRQLVPLVRERMSLS
ncbi:MAG: inositol monophosphatase family protein [Pseudomonadota bacterium]